MPRSQVGVSPDMFFQHRGFLAANPTFFTYVPEGKQTSK